MDFPQTLAQYLKAIESRNMSAFEETLANDGSLILIFPNGRMTQDYDEIIEFHLDWFEDTAWQIDFEVIKTEEGESLAWALLQVSYDDLDEDDVPYHLDYYMHLIFRKIGQRWRLIYDQNTVMDDE